MLEIFTLLSWRDGSVVNSILQREPIVNFMFKKLKS